MPPKKVVTNAIRQAVRDAQAARPLAAAQALLNMVKPQLPGINLKLVKEVLAETPTAKAEISASRKVSRYDYDTIRSKEYGRLVGDLMDFTRQATFNKTRSKDPNRGTVGGGQAEFKYALTLQDIRSRKVWMVPIKGKGWVDIKPAMATIFTEVRLKHVPISLTFDTERSVAGHDMKDWLAAGAGGTIDPENFTLYIVDKERHGPSQVRTLDAFHKYSRHR